MAGTWGSPTGEQWTIASGRHRATIVEVGGGVREYLADGEPVVDGYPADALPPAGAGQVLAPWPNRVGDGRYAFAGAEHRLALSEPDRRNAIHGLVRWLPWRRVHQDADSVTVACVLAPHPGYPFPLELTTRWSVGDGTGGAGAVGLRADHTAVNLGRVPAPFGLGVHPYVRVGGAPLDALTLRIPAGRRLVADDRMLPVGDEPVSGTPYDFTSPAPAGRVPLDTAFGPLTRGGDGTAEVRLAAPRDGRGVAVWMDEAFRWVQVYSGGAPSGRPGTALAVEPMTCPPDAFRSGTDLVTLAPGQVWRGSWGVRPLG